MSETVGAALKAAREQRKLTLAQVSESTKVRVHYLQALENDDISAMPSAAQARGFLRLYAEFLGLDLERLIPPPAADPETHRDAAVDEPAVQKAGLKLDRFLADLKGRLAPRRPREPSSESGTIGASGEIQATPRASSEEETGSLASTADKKKRSR